MKKIITIAMVFCVLLCCIGCSSRNSGEVVSNPPEDNASSESNTPITDSQSEDSYQPYDSTIEPPHILVFDSFEQMAELQKMLDEDDEIIYEYLRSKNYVMNGLSSKNDVVEFFKYIGDWEMLHLDSSSGYELAGLLYYVEYDYFMATYYKNEEDIVRFICYPGVDTELESSKVSSIGTDLVGNFDICSTTVGLHTVENTKSPFALIGKFETDNSLITILLTENDEAVIKNSISKNIIRTTCMDLIEN